MNVLFVGLGSIGAAPEQPGGGLRAAGHRAQGGRRCAQPAPSARGCGSKAAGAVCEL